MLTTIHVKNYGGEEGLTFWLAVDTESFDYDNMSRTCSIRLYAEGGVPGERLRSDGSDGSVTAFGKTFILPQEITINASRETTVGSWTVSDISNDAYPSHAVCYVSLAYTGEQSYVYPYSDSFTASIGAMHLSPVVGVVGGPRSELGSFIEFYGDVLEEGYEVNATVSYGKSTYYKYALQDRGNGFYSEEYWIADAENLSEIAADVTLIASYKGTPLPNTYTLTVTFCLGEDSGLPSATVTTGFRSSNVAIRELGIGVKNQTSFTVSVTDAEAFFGASVRSCVITVDGREYSDTFAESPILTESGEHSWSVTLVDSRWKKQVYSGSFTVNDYGQPEFSVELTRCDMFGFESPKGSYIGITVTPEKEYVFGGSNPYYYTFTYRAVGSAQSSAEILISPGRRVLYDAGLESAASYDVKVMGSDCLGGLTVKNYVLASERVELNIAKNKVAVGKKAQKENVFECAWDIEGDGDISFIDGSGVRKSIRSIYENERPACSFVTVSDENGLTKALNALSSSGGRGCFITLINVDADGLSLEKGLSAYLSFRTSGQTLVKKL